SREHAQILRLGGRFFIEDRQSRNGTFVNNQAISARVPLKNNDKIRICDFLAAFIDAPAAGRAAAETADDELIGGCPPAALLEALAVGAGQKGLLALVAWGDDLEAECRRLRAALEVNHVVYDVADASGLHAQLRVPGSPARQILGAGFHRVLVL